MSDRPVSPALYFGILTLAFALVRANGAAAAECGDGPGQARVACSCGDTVVRDTVLRPDDPVVRTRCVHAGLRVRAADNSDTIVLDLGGLSIVGSGVGAGIAVDRGGNDGALIRGGPRGRRGAVVGFGTGVEVRSPRAVRRIEHLEVAGQRRDGLVVAGYGTIAEDVRAWRNGGDGIRWSGQGGRLVDVEASENAGAGIRVSARHVACRAVAERNRSHGLVLRGARADLAGSAARGNRGFGVVHSDRSLDLARVVLSDNREGPSHSSERRDPR